ncbi:MAG: hypothetical protein QM754_17415 [Tepidisphaeraceae bacterium]
MAKTLLPEGLADRVRATVERSLWQFGCVPTLAGEHLPDHLRPPADGAFPLRQAATQQVAVQLINVVHRRHRRGEAPC